MCFLIDNGVKSDYDGIIVQRPILVSDASPKEAAGNVADFMRHDLDIDGVCYGSPFTPPPVRGLDLLLREWDYDPAGKTAVVIGRGDVGRPVGEYLCPVCAEQKRRERNALRDRKNRRRRNRR